MMADGKWISDLSPGMAIEDAALAVLQARLAAVQHYLPLAAENAASDVEHVHQLRVATRRAAAARRIFADCLPSKQASKLKRLLRNLRRWAGAARDWDVFVVDIRNATAFQRAATKPARDFLMGFAVARRLEAQVKLSEFAPATDKQLRQEVEILHESSTARADSRSGISLGQLASHRVADLVGDMESLAAASPSAYEELHQLRIVGKRLRYSMEIFVDCFSAPFRDRLYPAVEDLQELLGRITDAHVAVERLIQLRDHCKAFHRSEWARYRKPIEQYLQAQRRVFPRERKHFLAWWANWEQLARELTLESLLI
jgi:CHAD domain-containing protein